MQYELGIKEYCLVHILSQVTKKQKNNNNNNYTYYNLKLSFLSYMFVAAWVMIFFVKVVIDQHVGSD